MSLAHAWLNGTILNPSCQHLSPAPISYLADSSFPPSKPSSYAIIDSTVPHNRLFETKQGEILLISKTPAEVAGEKLLRPLTDTVHHLASKIVSPTLINSALSFGTSCLSFVQSLPYFVPLLPVASAQRSNLATASHKDQEQDSQGLLIEAPASAFSTWQKAESFASTPLKSLSSKELPSSAEAQSPSLSPPLPALFTKILTSPSEIEWSSPEFDKASLVSMRDPWNRTIFLTAVEEGRKDTVEILLAQNIAVHTVDSHGNNGLALAALNGYTDLIPLLSDHFSY